MLFRAHVLSSLPNRTRPPLHNPTSFPYPFVHSHVIVLRILALDPRRHVQTALAQYQLHSRRDIPSLPPRGPFLHLNPTIAAQQPLIRPLREGVPAPRLKAALEGTCSCSRHNSAAQPFITFLTLPQPLPQLTPPATQPFWLFSTAPPSCLPCLYGSAGLPSWHSC
jgi:hypothetical protein